LIKLVEVDFWKEYLIYVLTHAVTKLIKITYNAKEKSV